MKITYIEHSGFLVEMEDCYFLFDYYKGGIPELSPQKDIVVFVSHKHGDHYNSAIFTLLEKYPRVQYILSQEVPVKWLIAERQERDLDVTPYLHKVRRNADYEFTLGSGERLQLHTLKSTDIGVAYLLTYAGRTIYHAGDLNLWLWQEEEGGMETMKNAFFRSMEYLRGKEVDVAFVPLDPRLGEYAGAGLEAYLSETNTKKVFPMHCWGNYAVIREFRSSHPQWAEIVQSIAGEGEMFEC